VPVLVVAPAAWGRYASICEATAAAPLRELQGKAPVEGPVGLELESEDAALAPVIVAALRRPCFAVDLDVWPVAHGTPEAEWLLRSGTPLLRLHGGGADLQQPSARTTLRTPGRLRVQPSFQESKSAAVEGIHFQAGDEGVRGSWAVYTPWGCRSGVLDDAGKGSLDATAWKQLVQQGPAPHTGDRIRVLAVSHEEQPAYGWADLCLP
jgi:hypothetical protein